MATATIDNETTTKAKRIISPEQKKAGVLRRQASMLENLAQGSSNPAVMLADAAKLRSEALQLAPEGQTKPKSEPRPQCAFVHDDGDRCEAKATKGGTLCFSHTDDITKLSEAEWQHVEGYFIGDLRRHLLEGFSWRQLKKIGADPSTSA